MRLEQGQIWERIDGPGAHRRIRLIREASTPGWWEVERLDTPPNFPADQIRHSMAGSLILGKYVHLPSGITR